VIRRRLVANLTGPAVAGRPDDTVAALPSLTPSEPPDTARRPDHEITRGGWRRARALTREFKSRLLDLTTAPGRHGARIRSG
jgi:hypothetical protein